MNIECVIVCRDYADFLRESLPHNIAHVDRLVVVTSPKDEKTIALCKRWGVSCVETHVFDEQPGDVFNKGRAINLGLGHLRHTGWLLHLDADVVLPDRCREMLSRSHLDPTCLYGADRVDVDPREDAWKSHRAANIPQWRHHYLTIPPSGPLSARLVHWDHGYCPIGFFQLWHSSTKRIYPTHAGSAEHSDVLFAVQWPRAKRVLLPEIVTTHLTTDSEMGANWKGRTSPTFAEYTS
jgi:hypothetical protein